MTSINSFPWSSLSFTSLAVIVISNEILKTELERSKRKLLHLAVSQESEESSRVLFSRRWDSNLDEHESKAHVTNCEKMIRQRVSPLYDRPLQLRMRVKPMYKRLNFEEAVINIFIKCYDKRVFFLFRSKAVNNCWI